MWKPRRLKSPEENDLADDCSQTFNSCVINPTNLGMKLAESFHRKDHSCFASTELPSDFTVEIRGFSFHLHKTHPALTEHERKRLCRIMDCQKLSLDACMHAAQNERLPLRTVVQVIFCEQIRMRNALVGNSLTTEQAESLHFQQPRKSNSEGLPQPFQENLSTARKDIKAIKYDMEKMRAKFIELQHDHARLQEEFDKLVSLKQKGASSWTSGWKKLGKLKNSSLFQSKMYANDETAHDLTAQMPSTPTIPQERKPSRWRYSLS